MSFYPSVPRTDFGPPPPGYVAGVGRGAVGFTTRSDIGPARPMGVEETPAGVGRGRNPPPGFMQRGAVINTAATEEKKEADLSESNFDEFSGYSENLFGGTSYDSEDKEADLVYDAIDRRMDSKRKRRREELLKEELEKYRKERPIIQDQFKDLKRNLSTLKEDDWNNLPEALDYSRQNKMMSKVRDKFTPMPDTFIDTSRLSGSHAALLDPRQQKYGGLETPLNGLATPINANGQVDLTHIGRVRDKVLSLKLDRMADSVSGQTVVDPKGYLTDLNSIKVSSEAEVSDIKKARLLLNSVIQSNPKHAPGWIAAARLEKETGKLAQARSIIMKGCETCPTSEDVWLEAASLHPPKQARGILAKAVRQIPTSVKIWMRARDLEDELEAKKAVLRRSLEVIPNSVALWKAAVELETPEDARVMLGRAVELIPESVEMWLALARLETYEQARVVLNRARKVLPTEPAIWITAAKLEEANGNAANVEAVIHNAVKSLATHNVLIDRESWLNEAELAEKSGAVLTCQAIVRATMGIGVEDIDRKQTWTNDAEHYMQKGSIETARAIYAHMLAIFPGKKSIWIMAAQLEKQHGSRDTLDALLRKAVEFCPQAEVLWLMGAKEKWLSGDVQGARVILNEAFRANPDSEDIWLAAVKLERENKEFERARIILSKARERAPTPQVWAESARLERIMGDRDREHALLTEALAKFPHAPKHWVAMAELLTLQRKYDEARDTYKKGVKACPGAIDLWLNYAQLEISVSSAFSKARSILETARLKNPKNARLYLAAIRVEQKANNAAVAQQVMAKALQECPSEGILWAHAIASDARPARKSRSVDALKKCTDDPHVFGAVAKLFWMERKIKKARNWFTRAVTVNPDIGDIWVAFYKFEMEHGDEGTRGAVLKKCNEAEPAQGEKWKAAKNAVENFGVSTEALLKKMAEGMKEVFSID